MKLSEMESLEPNKILDVIAVVKNFEDYATIMTRSTFYQRNWEPGHWASRILPSSCMLCDELRCHLWFCWFAYHIRSMFVGGHVPKVFRTLLSAREFGLLN